MSISSLDQKDIHRITSGQVIIDLPTVLKELIENSLDAGTSKIEINFNDYGLNSLEVVDNGDGIDPKDFESIALNHHTSKLSSFEDITKLKTLGFRGEAVSSLCSTSSVVITTTSRPPKANKLEFSKTGELLKNTICSRSKGTTVHISNLFEALPVRQKDLHKNIKREFAKALSLISNYIIISKGVKFIVTNVNKKGKKQKLLNSQGSVSMNDNLLDIFGSNALFGLIPLDITLDLNQKKARLKVADHTEDYSIRISGLISQCSFGFGRPINDRQFWFINERPVSLAKFSKLINEVYKGYNHLQFPTLVLNIGMKTEYMDVNVTPDKRTILIHNETEIIEEFRLKLIEFFDGLDLSIPKNDFQRGIETFISKPKTSDDEAEVAKTSILTEKGFGYSEVKQEGSGEASQQEVTLEAYGDDVQTAQNCEQEETLCEDQFEDDRDIIGMKSEILNSSSRHKRLFVPDDESPDLVETKRRRQSAARNSSHQTLNEDFEGLSDKSAHQDDHGDDVAVAVQSPRPAIRQTPSRSLPSSYRNKLTSLKDLGSFRNDATASPSSSSTPIKKSCQATLEPVIMNVAGKSIIHNAYVKNDKLNFESCHCGDEHSAGFDHSKENGDEGVDTHLVEDDEISQYLDDITRTQASIPSTAQTDFMEIHETKTSTKRFSDQSQNYETTVRLPTSFSKADLESIRSNKVKEEIKIDNIEDTEESEKLLTLKVSKQDFNKMKIIGQFNLGFILVIRDGKDLFIIDQHASDEKFNFEDLQKHTVFQSQPLFKPESIDLNSIDELVVLEHLETFEKNGFNVNVDLNAGPGERISLGSLPISKKTVFGTNDFNELIHLIKENPQNPNVRCSKIRSMFAMRACRKSIMVGKSLNMKAMTKVVRNLGTLEKPWNCPHGRPTMRHLMELKKWEPFNKDYTTQ